MGAACEDGAFLPAFILDVCIRFLGRERKSRRGANGTEKGEQRKGKERKKENPHVGYVDDDSLSFTTPSVGKNPRARLYRRKTCKNIHVQPRCTS